MIAASETLFPSVSDIPVRNTSELPSETFQKRPKPSETASHSAASEIVRGVYIDPRIRTLGDGQRPLPTSPI